MLIRDNRRIIVKELVSILNISVGSVETIIKTHLHYRKLKSRWVPCTLTYEIKMARMRMASQLLGRFEEEAEQFLKSIVTTDET